MAAASASMFAAFGPCRRKLQLLQPRAGVRPTPLFSACAAGAADRAATVISGAIREPATSALTSLLIGPRPPDSRHAAARPPFVAPYQRSYAPRQIRSISVRVPFTIKHNRSADRP